MYNRKTYSREVRYYIALMVFERLMVRQMWFGVEPTIHDKYLISVRETFKDALDDIVNFIEERN